MEKRIVRFYSIFSALFFIIIVLLFALRLYESRSTYREIAESSLSRFSKSLSAAYILGEGFTSEMFSRTAQQFFRREPSVQAVVVYSYDTGVQYLLSRNQNYFDQGNFSSRRAENEYILRTTSYAEEQLASPLSVPDQKGVVLEAVFTVLPGSSIYAILRDTLFVVAIFILLTIILAVVLSLTEKGDQPGSDELTGAPSYESHEVNSASDTLQEEYHHESVDIIFQERIPEFRTGEKFEDFSIDETDLASEPFAEEELADLDAFSEYDEQEKARGQDEPAGPADPPKKSPFPEDPAAALETGLAAVQDSDQDMLLLLLRVPLGTSEENFQRVIEVLFSEFPEDRTLIQRNETDLALILPGKSIDEGLHSAEVIERKVAAQLSVHLLIGASSRNGRQLTAYRLLREAERALSKALDQEGERIVGFKTDPEKFNSMLHRTGQSRHEV